MQGVNKHHQRNSRWLALQTTYAPWMQSHQSHCICKTTQKAPADSLILFVCFKKKTQCPEELLPWRSLWVCSEEGRLPKMAGWDGQKIQARNVQLGNKTIKLLWGACSSPQSHPRGVEKEAGDQGWLWKFVSMQKTTVYSKPALVFKTCKGSWAEIRLWIKPSSIILLLLLL